MGTKTKRKPAQQTRSKAVSKPISGGKLFTIFSDELLVTKSTKTTVTLEYGGVNLGTHKGRLL